MAVEVAEIGKSALAEDNELQSIGYGVAKDDAEVEEQDSLDGEVAANGEASKSGDGAQITVARAGTTLYAINAMKLNSDYSNRVVVDIVGRSPSDPLYGSKAIGQFERKHKKLVLSLKQICLDGGRGCSGMDGIALDVKTAEVGLASDVDSHYWYRFGGLFAATILSGLSDAAEASGTREESITPTGSRVTTTGLNGRELVGRAVGDTGETFTQILAANVTRPPTAKLALGEEMAIILFGDIKIPAQQ
jgi:hypothetical protein